MGRVRPPQPPEPPLAAKSQRLPGLVQPDNRRTVRQLRGHRSRATADIQHDSRAWSVLPEGSSNVGMERTIPPVAILHGEHAPVFFRIHGFALLWHPCYDGPIAGRIVAPEGHGFKGDQP